MVNLRVISNLGPGDRLCCRRTDSHYLAIDHCTTLSWLWRWLMADNRDIAMQRLSDIVNETEKCLQSNEDSVCNHIKDLLSQAINGMLHLKSTYETDPTTVARILTMIKKSQDLVGEKVLNL